MRLLSKTSDKECSGNNVISLWNTTRRRCVCALETEPRRGPRRWQIERWSISYLHFVTVCSCVSVLCLKFGFLSLLPFLLRCLFHVWSEKGERVISPISMLHGASTHLCVSSAMGHAQFDPISCVMLTQCDLTQPGLAKLKVAVAVVHTAMH